jgi:hypothetical protein
VKFFHLNALSSPILTKVHFDVVITMIADTLYSRFTQHLRGFEDCDAPKIFRHFAKGKADIFMHGDNINVSFSKRAHNPILRAVSWQPLPQEIPPHVNVAIQTFNSMRNKFITIDTKAVTSSQYYRHPS